MGRVKSYSKIVDGWSEAQYWSAIRSALRSGMRFYPPKIKALNEAKEVYNGDNKRQKWCYRCNSCGECFMQKDVQVDHITPAGSLNCFSDLPQFVENLYCSSDNLQVLCKECHKAKTKKEGVKNV